MSEEQRLISVGFSEDASKEICSGLRKLGYNLEAFVLARESGYHRACAEIVKEAMD